MNISAVRAFKDNYIWVLEQDGRAVAVDPGDAAPLERHLDRHGLELDAVLITHHHADHTGGLPALAATRPGLPVFGPGSVAGVTRPVSDGGTFALLGERFSVLAIPGHTLDHLGYLTGRHLFCGDTLFGAGCGRIFEGTAEMMHRSLTRLVALPDDTLAYPAHEYTLANLAFALAIEPGNPALRQRLEDDSARRERGEATLPTSLAREKLTNPFLRPGEPAVRESAQRVAGYAPTGDAAVFAVLRDWKNRF
ncbi:hydroxyacylglutathione hydrolase [Paludibacterium paludis]|uniref:Hydroxyacylglutathione hydrolase n=1 Tax=Paludibacterium paludis TaxID=1225769 RepID=A0A918U752_9NEIS|nr:hydroxyacylglutathione hydrolase [Paludibacterium paludis]GGY04164.1 hydroxyacylglutathione hydrolase [Paludibacterium paludis]